MADPGETGQADAAGIRQSLRILVSGAAGFVGTELCRQLEIDGHTVVRLVRREPRGVDESRWSPETGTIDRHVVDSTDAVINLSGASLARLPWTRAYKREILHSRIATTTTIADAIAGATTPPSTFLSASAVGFYGDRPGEELTESAARGTGFLADVVEAWEIAAGLASAQSRVVNFRTGLIVGRGGAFTPLSLLTAVGLGSRLGSGRQFWPWISLFDEATAIRHLLTSGLAGPVNLVGPTPATAEHVTRELARAMHRWHPLAVPAGVIRLAMQEAGQDLLLSSQLVVPEKLRADGFRFTHETVSAAIDASWP